MHQLHMTSMTSMTSMYIHLPIKRKKNILKVTGLAGASVYSCGIPSGMKIHANIRNIYSVKNHQDMEVPLYHIIIQILISCTSTGSESFYFYTILGCSSGWSKFKDHCYKFDHKARAWKDTLGFCERYQVKAQISKGA